MAEPPSIPIRNATRDDIDCMFDIERAAGGASHWARSDYERVFEPTAPKRIAIVAGNPAQGFLVARIVDRDWEIENLAVAETARRRGLGRALLSELLQRAGDNGAESVTLEVRTSNHAARRLYESGGFREIAVRRAYYQDPEENAVIYRAVPAAAPKS